MKNGRIALRRTPLIAAIMVGGLATAARGDDKVSIARGEELAQRHCLGCHTRETQGQQSIAGVPVPSFRVIARQPHQTFERVQSILEIPHRPMPAIPLSLSDIRDISAYVMSFRE
jgi:mono/diheme cytochrome c family protein